jgi:bifunctional UDP-N-acetylglucosamine pyrophosphorylase/glucosamine-1-phosphate N-acetyltransferase
VTVVDPFRTRVEASVTIGRDTILEPNVTIRGNSEIGEGCVIGQGSVLTNAVLADNVTLHPYCVVEEAAFESDTQAGPFARIRPGSVLRTGAKVGNFVEMKKTDLGPGSKANHLSYLGDATIGEGVNVGAGTITCNYDGKNKFQTVLKDGVFIGSDVQLVAPVTVGEGAYVGAGTTVTQDVPDGALATSRTEQKNNEGWVARKKARQAEEGK